MTFPEMLLEMVEGRRIGAARRHGLAAAALVATVLTVRSRREPSGR